MKPRMNYSLLRKGGPHEKTKKARRKKDKQELRRDVRRDTLSK